MLEMKKQEMFYLQNFEIETWDETTNKIFIEIQPFQDIIQIQV